MNRARKLPLYFPALVKWSARGYQDVWAGQFCKYVDSTQQSAGSFRV